MKKMNWKILFGIVLVLFAVLIEILQYVLYHDLGTIMEWLINSLAFIPIQILVVTLFVDRLLKVKEKEAMLSKLNMVIGAFFSEVGRDLLRDSRAFDLEQEETSRRLLVTTAWTDREFNAAIEHFRTHESRLDIRQSEMAPLCRFLVGKRGFLLGLLENPHLLEHESFTDLLWSVFHLTEELSMRKDLHALAESDLDHLSGDLKRVYACLVTEWLAYLKHQKRDYPYLFSLAVRTNPFDKNATAEIRPPA
jgi:hypothetical protein